MGCGSTCASRSGRGPAIRAAKRRDACLWLYHGRVSTRLSANTTALRPTNPATLEQLAEVPVASAAELAEAVSEARAAQIAWGRTEPHERAAILARVLRRLVDDADSIAGQIVDETGKPIVEAFTHDLFVAADALSWLSRSGPAVLRERRVALQQLPVLQKRGWVRYEPVGVVGIVAPWNFPLGVPLTQTATAVLAGNGVVLKPSELTPHTGAIVERLFAEAGAPRGLVRVVQGRRSVGEALVEHPGLDHIVFTGSTETGRAVAATAASRLCPVTLELGGSDPMLVLDDADLDRAVRGALWAGFANAGQVCSGVERVYVADAVYEPFVERLVAAAGALRIGNGHDPSVELGPLISEGQRSRVEAFVVQVAEHGAVVHGGNRPDTGLPGWFLEPAVVVGGDRPRARADELFGPVVTVERFEDLRAAVRSANDSPYALGASVWTRDVARADEVARALRAGSVWHNDHAYSYGTFQAPWGGSSGSGYGRTHGREGLLSLSHVKYVDRDAGRITPGWWYPYSADVLDGFQGVLGWSTGDGVRDRIGALVRHRSGLAHLVRKALS